MSNGTYTMSFENCVDSGNGSNAPVIPADEPERVYYTNPYGVRNGNNSGGVESLQLKMYEIEKKLMLNIVRIDEKLNKKLRGKVLSESLAVTDNGTFVVMKRYEHGYEEAKHFFLGTYGNVSVSRICFFDHKLKDEIRCVEFDEDEMLVVFKPDKVTEAELHRRFLRAGIKITDGVTKTGKLLYKYFCCRNVESTITLPFRTGWCNGQFYDFSRVTKYGDAYPENAPILGKEFSRVEAKYDAMAEYLTQLNQLCDWMDRLMLLLFPFFGVIKSIIPEDVEVPYQAINVISNKPNSGKKIASFLQVYNRKELKVLSMDEKPTGLKEIIKAGKDDVILLHASSFQGDPYHEKTKPRKLVRSMIQLVSEEGRDYPVALVFITRNWIRESEVYNLILPEDFSSMTCTNGKHCGLEMVLTKFVSVVQEELEDARELTNVENVYEWIFGILRGIFDEQNLNLEQQLGLPMDIDFKTCFEKEDAESDELLELFVTATRKCALKLHFVNRQVEEVPDNAVFYDAEDLWIPSGVLEMILKEGGLTAYKNEILWMLKEDGYLASEKGGLTWRLKKNGIRKEHYRIQKTLFDKPGYVEIINLGKDGDAI